MAATIAVPKEYGYVLLTATASALVNQWHAISVASHRRAAKVPYPNAYASADEAKESKEKYLFNCAQRAHGNFMEHYPSMLVGMLVGGINYPVISACMGVAWLAGRIVYTLGYTDKTKTDGSGRRVGLLAIVPEFAMFVMTAMTGYKMLTG